MSFGAASEQNSSDVILYDVKNKVATITINQPQYANALGLTALQEIRAALEKADLDSGVGAIMFTGKGDYFSSGFNLKEIPLESQGGDGIKDIQQHFHVLAMWWHQVINFVTRIRKPVLSAVNGPAAGGGFTKCKYS